MKKMVMRKVLSCLVVIAILMSAIPYVVAAMNETGTGDHKKILDKESRLTMAESTSTAHLKNNLLDLHFTEQNSDLWKFQWQPGQWGESCYHEHFGVYTDNAGRTLESEEFTIDQPFTDPGGVPGTVTAILHYGDVQVKRKITLISGDVRFFEIEYTIKNIGSSTLNDVRFFQTIDFDIPWTGDHTDDHAWYDAEHDYVVVKDDEYFENSFTASIRSDRHGMAHWSTEIYDDWDDGNLNNANSYGPGDPAIGLQYNFGNLAPGDEEIVTITVWSGEPTVAMEPKFNSITFGDNKGEHHTDKYPSEYNVLRRGQSFDLNADIENFDDSDHKIIFEITKPSGETQEFTARKDGTLGSGWDCIYTRKWYNRNKFNFKIHIPGDEQVGKYQLIGEIQKKDGTETYDTYGDDEVKPEFYVIFNPWSSEDEDVYCSFSNKEMKHYITGSSGYAYYGGSKVKIPLICDVYSDGDGYWYGLAIRWTLAPSNPKNFKTAIDAVSGEILAINAARKINDTISHNAGYNNYIKHKLDHGTYKLGLDDPFLPSEIIHGNWYTIPIATRTASEIVDAWSPIDDKHPCGQCMHFGGLGTSLFRSIGIPARMITTIDGKVAHDPAPIKGDWNFHVWSESWLDGTWKPVATTYQVGPGNRDDSLFQTETEGDSTGLAGAVFVYDPLENKKDILCEYQDCTRQVSGSLQSLSFETIQVLVGSDKTQYDIGETVTINVTVKNNGDTQITKNLTTTLTQYHQDFIRNVFEDAQLITVPAHNSITKTYNIPQSTYGYNGRYTAVSYVENISNRTFIDISSGLNLTVTAPEMVTLNESFNVVLETKNILSIPITNIEIQADFPYYANVTGAPINFTIPTLAPGATNTTTWIVWMPDDGYQSMVFIAQSVGGGYEQIATGTEVMSNPFLRVDVEVPSSVQKDTTFAVFVTIVNEGDLAAENVQSELSLPPGLATSDDLIRYVGTIDPHANTTIVWNITATEAGTSAFTIVTNSSTTSGEDVIFIPIFIYDHDLELSVEQSQIEADGELHCINMTIHNLGNVEDSVLLQYLVTNRNISFSIYDGDERIISQPVAVPANGDKTLNLKIIPEHDATGAITIHATSELDPTASDSINIEVISPSLNQPPITPTLTPDKSEPQSAGTAIKWTASATDPDGDTLYYRFWIKGTSTSNSWAIMQDWSTVNTWTWHTSSADIGDTDISVWIRDGHHAPPDRYDLEKKVYDYKITAGGKIIYVDDDFADDPANHRWNTVQEGINDANDGDTIIVRDGIYNENIDVNKPHLTIKPENESENCIVQAANSSDHVFEVTADYVNISGFTVEGATEEAGIDLHAVDHCIISDNNVLNNEGGIYLYSSNNNVITNNSVNSNDFGIWLIFSSFLNTIANNNASNNSLAIFLTYSDNNMITKNNVSNNKYGIWHIHSNNSMITENIISNSNYGGLWLDFSDNNTIYLNNFINNTNNIYSSESTNTWNSAEKITYKYNGKTYENYLGNYWVGYNGSDVDSDGIGDTPYNINSDKDHYPLMQPWENYFGVYKPGLNITITSDKEEYPPGDYVIITMKFKNEGEEPVLITNPITTSFIASDGSIVLKEDLSYSISVTLGTGGQWSFGTSYKLPDDAPEGYYDVKVSISGGNYVKITEDLFYVGYPI